MSNIPQTAVDWLSSDPTLAKQRAFDAQFGAGTAQAALNPPAPAVEEEKSTLGAIASDVGEGLLKSPVSIATGLVEGLVVNPSDWIASTITGDLSFGPDGISYLSPKEYEAKLKAAKAEGNNFSLLGQSSDTAQDMVNDESITGGFIHGVSEWSGAVIGVGKFFKGVSKTEVAGKAALATFLGHSGSEGRISDMLVEWGIPDNMVTDFLKSDPDDSETMGRLKNLLEEGPLAAAGVLGVRMFRALKKGNMDEVDEILAQADQAKEALDNKAISGTPETPKAAPEATSGDVLEPKPVTSIDQQMKDAIEAEIDAVEPKPAGAVHKLTVEQHNSIDAAVDRRLAGQEDTPTMGWRRSEHINTHEDVQVEIASVRQSISESLANKPQTEKQWKAQAKRSAARLAKLANISEKDALASASKFDNPRNMAADLMARENYAIELSNRVREIAKVIRIQRDMPDASMLAKAGYKSVDEAKLDLMKHRELAANVIAQAQGQRSDIARAMRAMQIIRKGDPALQKILRNEAETLSADADQLVDQLDNITDADEALSAMQRVGDGTRRVYGAVNKFRINALLSGPGTQEINMVSNLINTFSIPTQQVIGGAVTLDGRTVMHGIRTYRGILGSAWESTRMASKSLYNDEAILDPFNGKIDIPQEHLGAGKVLKVVDKTVSLPSRFLLGMDEFFKQAAYRGRILADAHHYADIENLKGADKDKYIREYIKDSFDEQGAGTRADALNQAQRSTFTEQLDGEMSKMIQRAAVKSNTVRFVVPFVRTPINVLSQGFQQIPGLGLFSKRLRDDLAAGGPRRAQAIGKQMIGASLMTYGLHLVSEGSLTGSGPSDPQVRKQWLKTNQPYSYRIPQADGSVVWQPYQRYEPASYTLALMADVGEILGDDNIGDKEKSEVAYALFAALMENTVNKTFTQGLSDFFELLTDKEGRRAETIGEGIAGSFVPNAIPQILNQQEKLEIRGMVDSVLARMGMDSHIDRQRNALGEVIIGTGHKSHPLGGKPMADDPLQEEMTRLSEVHQTGFANPVSKIGGVELKDEMYSKEQSFYDRWMQYTGEVKPRSGPFRGLTLREAMEKLINDPKYKTLRDGDETYDGANVKVLKKVIRQYRNAAKMKLVKEDARFKEIFKAHDNAKKALRKPMTLQEDINNGSR